MQHIDSHLVHLVIFHAVHFTIHSGHIVHAFTVHLLHLHLILHVLLLHELLVVLVHVLVATWLVVDKLVLEVVLIAVVDLLLGSLACSLGTFLLIIGDFEVLHVLIEAVSHHVSITFFVLCIHVATAVFASCYMTSCTAVTLHSLPWLLVKHFLSSFHRLSLFSESVFLHLGLFPVFVGDLCKHSSVSLCSSLFIFFELLVSLFNFLLHLFFALLD